jgi:hypothetical protein
MTQSSYVTRRVQQLYDEHGKGETYLTPDAVQGALAPYLPGVRIIQHLEWRYTAIWTQRAEKSDAEDVVHRDAQ